MYKLWNYKSSFFINIYIYFILGSSVNTRIVSLFYFGKSMLNLIEMFRKNFDMFNLCNSFWNFGKLFRQLGKFPLLFSQFLNFGLLIHYLCLIEKFPVIHTSDYGWKKNYYAGHDLLLKLVFIKIYVFRYWNSFQFSFSFVCLVYLNNIHP